MGYLYLLSGGSGSVFYRKPCDRTSSVLVFHRGWRVCHGIFLFERTGDDQNKKGGKMFLEFLRIAYIYAVRLPDRVGRRLADHVPAWCQLWSAQHIFADHIVQLAL